MAKDDEILKGGGREKVPSDKGPGEIGPQHAGTQAVDPAKGTTASGNIGGSRSIPDMAGPNLGQNAGNYADPKKT